MHTIETTGVVTPDHQMVVRSVPADVPPGEHAVVVTIKPSRQKHGDALPLFRSTYPIVITADNVTFMREDIYEDVDR